MRKLVNYLLLAIILLSSYLGSAQSYSIETVAPQYVLTNNLEIYHDKTTSLTFEELQNQSFIPIKGWETDFTPQQIYWGKIEITNQLPDNNDLSEWVLRFSLIFTDLKIYVVDSKDLVKDYQTGFFVPTHQKSFAPISKQNIVKIQIPAGDKITLYFRGESKRKFIDPNFDLELLHSASFFSELKKKKQQNGMYIGFVLMMLVYNFFLFIYARDKSYLYYSIYILGISIFSLYNSGDLADWMQSWLLYNNPHWIYFFKPAAYITFMGYLTFLRSFLNLETLLPRWDKIFKIFSYLTIPVIIIDYYLMWYSTFSYNFSDIAAIGYALAFLVLCFSFLIPLYKTKDRKGLYIIAGFSLMGFGLLATIWMRLQTVDFSVVYFRVGTILELIIFSLGMAYRQKEVEEERMQAKFELQKTKILQDIEHQEAERLKELNNIKSRLYTNITHEFRTPLTVIMGMTENIQGHKKEKELIGRNSNNLLRLINQILDLSKAESGNLKTEIVQADIINFLRYLTESFNSMATAKNIQLTFYSEEKELVMGFDEQKIQHIIYNLLSNAIKYTPEKGKIVFHVKKDNEQLFLKVKDNGQGIPSKDLPFIFDRFFKVDHPSASNSEGVGIGLALTKELIEFLGGEISIKSDLGEGSEFNISLPIHISDLSNEEAKLDVNILLENENKEEVLETIVDESPEDLILFNLNKKEHPLLLLIEDNNDVVTYIQSCLDEEYEIIVASDGQEGIEQALEFIPDIIVSDLMMPIKNGLEVCKTLKKDGKTSHIPIVLLTAKATQEDKIEGLETGADAFMMKPFHKQELRIRLKKLIENRIALQAKYGGNLVSISKKTNNLDDDFLRKIIDIIEAAIDNPNFSVTDLSKEMHLSSTQMYRKLKAITGHAPNKFIRRYRLQKGLELLQNSTMNIGEIAYQVGFSDPNYFSRAFSEEFGKPPSDIRK